MYDIQYYKRGMNYLDVAKVFSGAFSKCTQKNFASLVWYINILTMKNAKYVKLKRTLK